MREWLAWPFFEPEHRELERDVDAWAAESLGSINDSDVDAAAVALVRHLGERGWLRWCVAEPYVGAKQRLDVRGICVIRETLARHSGLADVAFAMQGLSSGPISLFGSESLKAKYLPKVGTGGWIGAFAISEPDGGSDIAAMTTTARRDGSGYVLEGIKTWISNAGIADFYVVFARLATTGDRGTGGQGDGKGYLACVVDADNPGLSVPTRIDVAAPHPLGALKLQQCRVPADAVIGVPGEGLKVALATLDTFRPTVGAAALGFARRALEEALAWSRERRVFGKALAEHQLTQARLADMATAVDAAALLVYRAAWKHDTGAGRITREAAMAKLFATEAAQRVVDDAVQLFGGRGVVSGHAVERLYREVRALRVYEGTSEIQKLVIAAQLLGAGR
jgi:acyl-CoA dehydrogenase